MVRSLLFLPLLVIVISGCITSESGGPSAPEVSVPSSASDAGRAALVSGSLNPETCEGVLGSPPPTHTLGLQALTATAQESEPSLESMCAAIYETSVPGDPFLTVALIQFESDGPAVARYDLLREVFVTQGMPISEVTSADEQSTDWFSALIDSDGIGRTTVVQLDGWVLTISNGPTTEASLWTADDLQLIGESIVGRAHGR